MNHVSNSRLWRVGIPLVLCIFGAVLYLQGIRWGLPQEDLTRPSVSSGVTWGADEIAPGNPLRMLAQIKNHERVGFLKYPLFHYMVCAGSYAPYLLYLKFAGGLGATTDDQPYGLLHAVQAFQSLTVIARGVSIVMALGTILAAYFLAWKLWGRVAGLLAGVFVLLMYPMNYYGVMSNVDGPSLFWCSLAFLVAADIHSDGWTVWRAIWFGTFSALAIATKDQSYAVLLLLPLGLLYTEARRRGLKEPGDVKDLLRAPIVGLVVSVVVYLLASGVAISPAGFKRHVDFILSAEASGMPSFWYFRYDQTLVGFAGLLLESFQQIVDTQGWILFAVACIGIVVCAKKRERGLYLLLTVPLLFGGVILAVRHTAIRFLLPVGFVLALFAAYALANLIASGKPLLRAAAVLIIVAGAGLQLWRATDLLYVMRNDSRLQAGKWLEARTRPGDKIEFFELASLNLSGRVYRLPPVPNGVTTRNASLTALPENGKMDGAFAITQGPDDLELHWFCSAEMYRGLNDGSLGYALAAVFDSPGRFSHEHLVLVSPRVEIYVRKDLAQERGVTPIQHMPAR